MNNKIRKLTKKQQRIYESIMYYFPATSHETALDKALQGGTNFQFYYE